MALKLPALCLKGGPPLSVQDGTSETLAVCPSCLRWLPIKPPIGEQWRKNCVVLDMKPNQFPGVAYSIPFLMDSRCQSIALGPMWTGDCHSSPPLLKLSSQPFSLQQENTKLTLFVWFYWGCHRCFTVFKACCHGTWLTSPRSTGKGSLGVSWTCEESLQLRAGSIMIHSHDPLPEPTGCGECHPEKGQLLRLPQHQLNQWAGTVHSVHPIIFPCRFWEDTSNFDRKMI